MQTVYLIWPLPQAGHNYTISCVTFEKGMYVHLHAERRMAKRHSDTSVNGWALRLGICRHTVLQLLVDRLQRAIH